VTRNYNFEPSPADSLPQSPNSSHAPRLIATSPLDAHIEPMQDPRVDTSMPQTLPPDPRLAEPAPPGDGNLPRFRSPELATYLMGLLDPNRPENAAEGFTMTRCNA
jgi:hypothetical protein